MVISVVKINMDTCICLSRQNKQHIKGNEKQGYLIDLLTCKAMDPKHSFNRSSLLVTMSSKAIFLRIHSSKAYKDQTKIEWSVPMKTRSFIRINGQKHTKRQKSKGFWSYICIYQRCGKASNRDNNIKKTIGITSSIRSWCLQKNTKREEFDSLIHMYIQQDKPRTEKKTFLDPLVWR